MRSKSRSAMTLIRSTAAAARLPGRKRIVKCSVFSDPFSAASSCGMIAIRSKAASFMKNSLSPASEPAEDAAEGRDAEAGPPDRFRHRLGPAEEDEDHADDPQRPGDFLQVHASLPPAAGSFD